MSDMNSATTGLPPENGNTINNNNNNVKNNNVNNNSNNNNNNKRPCKRRSLYNRSDFKTASQVRLVLQIMWSKGSKQITSYIWPWPGLH